MGTINNWGTIVGGPTTAHLREEFGTERARQPEACHVLPLDPHALPLRLAVRQLRREPQQTRLLWVKRRWSHQKALEQLASKGCSRSSGLVLPQSSLT